MSTPDRSTLRLTRLIFDRIRKEQSDEDRQRSILSNAADLSEYAKQIDGTRARLSLCREKGWAAAWQHQEDVLRALLGRFSSLSSVVTATIRNDDDRPLELTFKEVLEDLQQIRDEFGGYTYRPKEKTLSVTTKNITLEDVPLGKFSIVLHLDQIGGGSSHPYRIEALDPNPAYGHHEVTHPHVSAGNMCEGEASTSIGISLTEGRLCDFFILVRNVLNTYNDGSPYVHMSKWEGNGGGDDDDEDEDTRCHDCGDVIDDDQTYSCDQCNHYFCNDCITYCECCDSSGCKECLDLEKCPGCNQQVCDGCRVKCSECDREFCKDCITTLYHWGELHEFCPDCHKDWTKANDPNYDPFEADRYEAGPFEPLLWDEHDAEADTADVADRAVASILEGEAASDDAFARATAGPDLTDGAPTDEDDDIIPDIDQAGVAHARNALEAAMARGPALATAGV